MLLAVNVKEILERKDNLKREKKKFTLCHGNSNLRIKATW